MHKSFWQQLNEWENARILSVDFHDFLDKEAYLEDEESTIPMGMTLREVLAQKNRMRK